MANKINILSFLFLIATVKCDISKSSLVFVIDDTGSMWREIDTVKRHVNSLFDTVLNTKSSQIDNFVLVTFNDPEYDSRERRPKVILDRWKFKQALQNINVDGGGDCPEYSLSGIESALRNSLPRSTVFIFTDANAKDIFKYEQVKSLAQEKMSQLIFVLTGICTEYPESLWVYPSLAEATSGHVFELSKTNIDQIIDFVKETAKGRNTQLATAEFPPGQDNKLFYAVDDYTTTVLITVIGLWPSIFVTDPDGHTPNNKKIVDEPNLSVVKVEGNKTGIYTATIGSTTKTKVEVTGRTTIDFQHGFSTSLPTSIQGTSIKPEPDVKSYLSIDLTVMEGGDVKLTNVKLLDLNGKVLIEKPLQPSNKNFYVTAPFDSPKQSFRIMITGYAVANNAQIKRLAPTPIEPKSVAPKLIFRNIKYTASAGDKVLRIPYTVTGHPQPSIQWLVGGKVIRSDSKYTIRDDALLIHSVDKYQSNSYTCVAKNFMGEDKKTIDVTVYLPPKIDKQQSSATVNVNSNAAISCKILEGNPAPQITWFYKSQQDGQLQDLHQSGETLRLPSVTFKDSGYYVCVAENAQGRDQFDIHVIVQGPPHIESENGETAYTALVGDIVLRIPVHVTGYPKPTVTWTVNGTAITSGSKYIIKENALLVRLPKMHDNGKYTCTATNKLGKDTKTFEGIIDEYITSYGNTRPIYVLKGTSKRIDCLIPHSDSDLVTWFVNGQTVNTTEPYVEITEADESKDGNYTCRVSNESGYKMETYVVDVGNAPTFISYQEDTSFDWDGNTMLECSTRSKPSPKTEWYYEGAPLKANDDSTEISITGWGKYSCKVTNVHGSAQRTFNVFSSTCLIHKEKAFNPKSPILVTENRMWPQYKTNTDYLVVPHQEKVILSCQSQDTEQNSFNIFDDSNEIEAECAGNDTFKTNGKIYKYSDLYCKNQIKPSIVRTGQQCLTKDTEMIKVGYKVKKMVEVYRVCFDKVKHVPMYTQLRNINKNDILLQSSSLFISDSSSQKEDCVNPSSTCCIAKDQLVKSNDVALGAPQQSTFVDNLNAIHFWRPCDDSNITWNSIGESVKRHALISDPLGVWSGASIYSNVGGRMVPQYLWKLIKYDEGDAMAIVYINDPHPNDSQKLCKNICTPEDGLWFQSNAKHIYCCNLRDFSTAFNIRQDVFTN